MGFGFGSVVIVGPLTFSEQFVYSLMWTNDVLPLQVRSLKLREQSSKGKLTLLRGVMIINIKCNSNVFCSSVTTDDDVSVIAEAVICGHLDGS